jgi:hypothetical protein
MKYLLATLGGAALTLCIFAGGVAFAITYLAADRVPVKKPSLDASLVFRTDVVKVDPKQQDYERVEARVAPERTIQTGSFIADVELVPEIDDLATAALPDADLPDSSSLSDEHVNWCQSKYRSYRRESNSYTPYGGGTRECVSPFSEEATVTGEDEPILLEASASESSAGELMSHQASGVQLSDEHIMSCFERYRSYRPEDNTYQPYSGGPRVQCQ